MALPTGLWQNADGLSTRMPDFWKNPALQVNIPRGLSTMGAVKQVELDIDLTKIATGTVTYSSDLDNDGTLDGFNDGDWYLPAYASVINCYMIVQVAAAGGTSIKIGTFGKTGSAIDDDFIVTATEGVTANFTPIGARTFGNGVGVATTAGTASVGSADAYVAVTGSGTFTAGKLRVIITYLDPLADS